jgi:nucleoside-triphosphatase THEP1
MLGYIVSEGMGTGDRLIAAVAEALAARDVVLAGAVQMNVEHDPARPCHMDLRVLGQGGIFRISEERGRHAKGCRLDPRGLAQAVQQVASRLEREAPDLVIVNKFGKEEAQGGGFREVIGRALSSGVPVLTSVSARNLPAFLDFAGGLATEVPAELDRAVAWCDAESKENGRRRSA